MRKEKIVGVKRVYLQDNDRFLHPPQVPEKNAHIAWLLGIVHDLIVGVQDEGPSLDDGRHEGEQSNDRQSEAGVTYAISDRVDPPTGVVYQAGRI